MISKNNNNNNQESDASSSFFHLNNNNNDDKEEEDLDISLIELEKAREAFESMMKEHESITPTTTATSNQETSTTTTTTIFCPLTQSDRLRRLLEIDLLESLYDSDDAIEDLMHLWMNERDGKSASALEEMSHHCSPGLREEEVLLGDMIAQHGGTWVEPASRLAAVKYMQGDSHASQKWCDHVLTRKPWHFEVLQTQLLNQLRLEGSSTAKAVWKAARMTLPPITKKNQRRRKWVDRAVEQAKAALAAKEADLQRYQRPDDILMDTTEEQAAWQ